MFQLLPCSNCQRTFSLREEASEETWLKCPNCGNQFRLGDVLDAFYSPWQIIPAPGAKSDDQYHTETGYLPLGIEPLPTSAALNEVRNQNFFESDRTVDEALDITTNEVAQLDELSGGDDVLELLDSDSADNQATDPLAADADQGLSLPDDQPGSGSHGKPTLAKARARSSKGPSIWTFVQVMLGGAASIPVTLLLLWHVVGKDVMNAGPKVAQYAPWIVPSKFHHTSLPDVPSRPQRPPVNPPAPGESGFRNFDDVLPMDGNKLASPAANQSEPIVERAPVETDTKMTELFATVNDAKKKISDYDVNETNSATIASRITVILDDLSAIAERLAEVPADGGAIKLLRNELKDIGRALSANPKLEAAFKSGVRAQFNGALKRTTAGRVYLGNATEVNEEPDKWLVKHVEAPAGKIPGYNLQATIAKAVAVKLEPNTKVFLLGTLSPATAPQSSSAPNLAQIEASFLQELP